MKFLCTAIMAIALFAFTGCGGSKSTALPATQNAPTFSSAAVNDYVKNLSQVANEYVAAIKAKDAAKIATLTPKFNEAFAKGQSLVSSLKPEELTKLQGWINTLTQQMRDAATTAAAAPAAK